MTTEAPPRTRSVLHLTGIKWPLTVSEHPVEVRAICDNAYSNGEQWITLTDLADRPVQVRRTEVTVIHEAAVHS